MTPTQPSQAAEAAEREKFEARVKFNPANPQGCLALDADGEYASPFIYAMWTEFQAGADFARAELARPAAEQGDAKDAERLDWLDSQGTSYGFQDMHEGNRWMIGGPFSNVRNALDAAIFATKADAPGRGQRPTNEQRYQLLRDMMRFTTRDGVCTMTLKHDIPAPSHDSNKDWMAPRFEASVDQAIDAAILASKATAAVEGK